MTKFEIVLHTSMTEYKAYDAQIKEWIRKNASEYIIAHHKPFKGEKYENDDHYHYYVKMRSNWDNEYLAKSLGVKLEMIEYVKKQWTTAILYARHINQEDKGKPLILLEDCDYNIKGYEELCEKALNHELGKTSVMPSVIKDYAEHRISFNKMKNALSFEEWNRWQKEIKNAQSFRVEKGIKRDMKVFYITGASGSGKTTLAKFMGENLGYDVFVSGSGSDPLDGYDDEECIILDDLRADVFTKAELFKLLDNNTNSSVKSRYFNKAISHCKIMIITSVKAPHELYCWTNDDKDPFTQLARRLKYQYLKIEDDTIYTCSLNKDNPLTGNVYKSVFSDFNMKVVYSYYNIVKNVSDGFNDIFKAISKNARQELEKRNGKIE